MKASEGDAAVGRAAVEWGRWLRGALLVLALPLVPFALIGELPGGRWLRAADGSDAVFGLAGAALLAIDTLLPVPSSVLGALIGSRLGALPGFLWIWTGLGVGSAIGYGVGRLLPARAAAPLPGRSALWLVFLARPVPVLAEAALFAAGAARAPVLGFALVASLGNALYAAALAGSGAWVSPLEDGWGWAIPLGLPALGWLTWRVLGARRARAEAPQGKSPQGPRTLRAP